MGADSGWEAGLWEPVQLERIEHERDNSANGGRHIPLLGMRGADPVAERAGLGHPTAHVAKGEPADQRAVRRREDEQRIAHVLAKVAQIMADAAAEGGAGELVGGPERLPRREELAARGAKLGP